MPLRKVDNSHHFAKLRLREDAVRMVGKSHMKVLDAYSGRGVMWKALRERMPEVTFDVTRIDKKPDEDDPHLIRGDNARVMRGMDLTQFDLIDLDAYGVPSRQLEICAEGAPDVPVVVTCIITRSNQQPHTPIIASGIPPVWVKETTPVLWARWWHFWWDNYCATLGYRNMRTLRVEESMRKRYDLLYNG